MGADALPDAKLLLGKFKAAFQADDLSACSALLVKLKLKLTELPALPPLYGKSPTAEEELLLARDVLEHAVLLSVKGKDEQKFERNYLQLRTYYTDTRNLLPPSPQEGAVVGLNLLRLLVQNRIAEFHTELELLPNESAGPSSSSGAPSLLSDPCVRTAIEVEQCLMEGAYTRVLAARQSVPHPSFSYFMDLLMATVRSEIASSSEKAYELLPVAAACKLLMMSSEAELQAYAKEHSWEIKDGQVLFQKPAQQQPRENIPSMQLVSQALGYARELERIV